MQIGENHKHQAAIHSNYERIDLMFKNYKFNDKEIAEILNNAVILIDTREKDNFQTRLLK